MREMDFFLCTKNLNLIVETPNPELFLVMAAPFDSLISCSNNFRDKWRKKRNKVLKDYALTFP